MLVIDRKNNNRKDHMIEVESYQIKRISDMEKFGKEWERLQSGSEMTFFQTFSWNCLLVKEFFKKKYDRLFSRIEIIAVKEAGAIILIAPLIIQKAGTDNKFGGRAKGIYFLGNEGYSDYLNFIYDKCDFNWIDSVIIYIRDKYPGFDICFNSVRSDSKLKAYMDEHKYEPSETGVAVRVEIKSECSADEYESSLSKHTRQNLRTAQNRLNTDGKAFRMEVTGPITDKEKLSVMRKMHSKRVILKNKSDKDDIIHKFSATIRVLIRLYGEYFNNVVYQSMQQTEESVLVITYIDDKIAGYLYGVKHKSTVYILQNSVDLSYKFYSPMFLGAYKFICDCYKDDNDIEVVDFTRGGNDYKYRLGGEELTVVGYRI